MKTSNTLLFALACAAAAQSISAYNREDAIPLPMMYDTLFEKFRRGEKISEAEKQAAIDESNQYRTAVDIANNTSNINEWLEADRMGYYLMHVKHAILFPPDRMRDNYPMTHYLRDFTAPGFKKQHVVDDDPFVAFCHVITALPSGVRDLDGAVNAYNDLLERDAFLAGIAKKWIADAIPANDVSTDPKLNQKFLDAIGKRTTEKK